MYNFVRIKNCGHATTNLFTMQEEEERKRLQKNVREEGYDIRRSVDSPSEKLVQDWILERRDSFHYIESKASVNVAAPL